MKPVAEQLGLIKDGIVELVPEDLLVEKLRRAVDANKPLRVKQGFDPTAPDIHLGHTVGLRKLRQFQDLGHTVIFLVGDFTGLIGDPSGRSETRKRMTREQLVANAETYTRQAFRILREDRTEVRFNSEWLAGMTFPEVLELTATQTVARMLERDDFHKRYTANKPISLLEFVYPLAQGYDSVALEADVEIGGTEQTFNLLMAREIQKAYGQEPQVILTLPILEGTDGIEKMSKSLGNYIGITDTPEEMFGKTMSIPDELIVKYFQLATSCTPDEVVTIQRRLAASGTNPSHVKRELAARIIGEFYDADAAKRAEAHFDRIHVQHDVPTDIDEVHLDGDDGAVWIVRALTETKLCTSNSQARRMIQQGAVSVDGEKLDDIDRQLHKRSEPYTIKVGKRRFIAVRVG